MSPSGKNMQATSIAKIRAKTKALNNVHDTFEWSR